MSSSWGLSSSINLDDAAHMVASAREQLLMPQDEEEFGWLTGIKVFAKGHADTAASHSKEQTQQPPRAGQVWLPVSGNGELLYPLAKVKISPGKQRYSLVCIHQVSPVTKSNCILRARSFPITVRKLEGEMKLFLSCFFLCTIYLKYLLLSSGWSY